MRSDQVLSGLLGYRLFILRVFLDLENGLDQGLAQLEGM